MLEKLMCFLQFHYEGLLATDHQYKMHTKTACSSRVVVHYLKRKIL